MPIGHLEEKMPTIDIVEIKIGNKGVYYFQSREIFLV